MKAPLSLELVDEIFLFEATEQYIPMALFITLYTVALIFESVDEILTCDYSNDSY